MEVKLPRNRAQVKRDRGVNSVREQCLTVIEVRVEPFSARRGGRIGIGLGWAEVVFVDWCQSGLFVVWAVLEDWMIREWTCLQRRKQTGVFDNCILRRYHVSHSLLMFWERRRFYECRYVWRDTATPKSRP